MARRGGLNCRPATVAELGPGDSLGVGLAALLSGARRYYAFDVVRSAAGQSNGPMLEELIELFRRREPIPGPEEFPRVGPRPESYEFPADILTDHRMDLALATPRLDAIRRALRVVMQGPAPGGRQTDASSTSGTSVSSVADSSDVNIRYFAPWYDTTELEPGSVDMILAQAVLEYVPDLGQTYRACHRWLAAGGFVSLTIDYGCHDLFGVWDGHWARGDLTWKLIRGKRPFLNRRCHGDHLLAIAEAELELVFQLLRQMTPATPRTNLPRDSGP